LKRCRSCDWHRFFCDNRWEFAAHSRSAFNDLAQIIVQTTAQGGETKLTADSPSLKTAGVTLRSR